MKKIKKLTVLLLSAMMISSCFAGCTDEDTSMDANSDGEVQVDEEFDSASMEGAIVWDSGEEIEDNRPIRGIHRNTNPPKFIPAVTYDGTPLTEDFYPFREALTEEQKAAYDILREGMLKGEKEIEMRVPLKREDAKKVFWHCYYDSADCAWTYPGYGITYSGEYVISIRPKYYFKEIGTDDVDEIKKKVEEATADARAALMTMDKEIDKVKYAHDYITHNVNYNHNAPVHQCPYSSLVNHEAVCAGYTRGFQYLMQRAGVRCTFVCRPGHAWNMVNLDGEWYGIDVTFDDPTNWGPDNYRYTYFNLTEEEMGESHERDTNTVPPATGTKYSYKNYFNNDAYGTDFSKYPGYVPDNEKKYPVKPETDPKPSDETTTAKPAETTAPTETTVPEETNVPDNSSDDDWMNNTGDNGEGWWNILDETWAKSDWGEVADGLFGIYDEFYETTYYWNMKDKHFYAVIDGDNEFSKLNIDTNEWVPAENPGVPVDKPADTKPSETKPAETEPTKPETEKTEPQSTDGWWNILDPDWTKEDWTKETKGLWSIPDEEVNVTYYYDVKEQTFYYVDNDTDEEFIFDSETNDWIPMGE